MPTRLYFLCIAIAASSALGAAATLDVKDLPVHPAMPDPLTADDGHKITKPNQWPARRSEMKRVLEDYEFGHIPPPPGNVTGHEVESGRTPDGALDFRAIHLSFGPEAKLGFDIRIYAPASPTGSKTKFPTIIHLTYRTGDQSIGEYAEAFRRGYAVVQLDYRQLGADSPSYRQTGFFPTYPTYDWNDFAAWAWGVSRCVDYLETDPSVDKGKILAVGVSRLAQAVQFAGAMDERISLVGAVGGGCAFRFSGHDRGGKQGLDEVIDQNTYWFGPKLAEFYGQTDKLPFDQHWMIALAAPRYFILCDALDDQYCGVNAAVQSYLAAKPAYTMLGVPDHLGIHFRPGPHGMQAPDWLAILDFSDKELRGMKVNRTFDQLPTADQSH